MGPVESTLTTTHQGDLSPTSLRYKNHQAWVVIVIVSFELFLFFFSAILPLLSLLKAQFSHLSAQAGTVQ
jgi:hypothetical protein